MMAWPRKLGAFLIVTTLLGAPAAAFADGAVYEEVLLDAQDAYDRVSQLLADVTEMENEATSDGEEARVIRCLTEKRQSLEGLLQSIDISRQDLLAGGSGMSDQELTHHETVVQLSAANAENLNVQAQQCGGAAVTHTEGSESEMRRDGRIPDRNVSSTSGSSGPFLRPREIEEDPSTPES